jgi:type I restriction enzyme S subunit
MMEMREWKEYSFSELLIDESISYGIVQPGEHTEIDSVPIIRVNNIKNGNIKTDDVLRVSSSIEKSYQRTRLFGGELLITVVGSIGECAIVPIELVGWNVARAVSVARIKDDYDKRFVKYAFKTDDIIFQMYGNTNDTVQPTLNLSSLKNIKLTLPPLPEQRAIASVLGSLDDKIDLLHRQNKTLEAMAETIFRQWFVEEAKEEWEEGKIPQEFDYTMGSSPTGDSYNELGDGIPMFQGNADFKFRFPKKRVFTIAPVRIAEKYDTLVSVRAPVGDQNMAEERCCIGRGVAAFRYKANPEFYSYTYFKMKSLMAEIKQFNETGTVFGSISKGDFESLEITVPPLEIVTKFQIEVKPIDDKIITNCSQIRTLSTLRDTLLPKLMSGDVRVAG